MITKSSGKTDKKNERKLPPKETNYQDLIGVVSINIDDSHDFNSLAAKLVGYDKDFYEAVALRVFIEHKPIVTVYAKYKDNKVKPGAKLPVHKFKKEMTLDDLFYQLRSVNFTVSTGEFNIEDMEVVNK